MRIRHRADLAQRGSGTGRIWHRADPRSKVPAFFSLSKRLKNWESKRYAFLLFELQKSAEGTFAIT